MRTNLTAVLAVWAAIGPMTGIVLGHFLTRSLEEKRWHLDNRTQEYRELLSSLATAYMNMLNFKGGDKDEYFRVERLKMESFRLLRDRILIADEIASADIVRLWAQAFHNFEANKDEKIFADRFTKINETLVSMARKTP